MAPLDLAGALPDISEAEPAGPNLEDDRAFAALERAAQGKPERQYGATIIPPEEPDWKDVEAQSLGLMDQTRDLRVLAHLAVARLHLHGLSPFAETLAQTRMVLEQRWDTVHPQLDPEDGNDPTLRANALLRLGDPIRVIRFLRNLPLAASQYGGPFSWRDIAMATGAIENDGKTTVPSEADLRGVFRDSDRANVLALRDAAGQIATEAAAITGVFASRAGSGKGPDFDDLVKIVREIERYIVRYTPEQAPAAPEAPAPTDAGAPVAIAETASRPPINSIASITSLDSRGDALRMLELVGDYFQRREPSSPLPLLIERARRIADMNFLDILRDLAPDGLGQAQIVVQPRDGQ